MSDMDSKLDKIVDKLDSLDNRIDNVDITLAKQSVVLEDHTRRSLANEEQVAILREQLHLELKPIKSHVDMVHGAFKFIGLMATLAAIGEGLIKVVEFIGLHF